MDIYSVCIRWLQHRYQKNRFNLLSTLQLDNNDDKEIRYAKQPLLIILGIVFLFAFGVAYLYLQNNNPAEEKGSISGTVVDATSGKPLKSVSVTAIE